MKKFLIMLLFIALPISGSANQFVFKQIICMANHGTMYSCTVDNPNKDNECDPSTCTSLTGYKVMPAPIFNGYYQYQSTDNHGVHIFNISQGTPYIYADYLKDGGQIMFVDATNFTPASTQNGNFQHHEQNPNSLECYNTPSACMVNGTAQ